jgi:hypothetical protein
MADNSMLDKALGFISSVQDARKEGRDEFMRTILPEVLQPEELKQAAAPMKEEASKTLHAPKYDRRMKFNTALERSGHKATSEGPVKAKEEPEWLKEAVNKIASDPAFDFAGVTGREGVVTVEDELERTPPLPTEEPMSYDVANKPVMQKESANTAPPLSMTREEIEDFAGKNKGYFELSEPTASEKALPIVGGVGMGILPMAGAFFNPNPSLLDLGVGGLAGVGIGLGTYGLLRHRENKHRARAQALVDRLNAVSNTPKIAAYPEDETFTQRHPWVIPAGVGLLGATAGAIPGGLLGGRAAVKSVTNSYNKRLAELGAEFTGAANAQGRASSAGATKEELKELTRKTLNAERDFAEATENKPDLGYHKALGHVGGGTLGGLTGGSLGVLGGLAANKPQPWEQ